MRDRRGRTQVLRPTPSQYRVGVSNRGWPSVDTTIEGRERQRVNVRYPRELRDRGANRERYM